MNMNIIKENSLLKEAALDFFLSGFIFLPLRRPKKVFFKKNHSVVKKIKPLFENVFKSLAICIHSSLVGH